MALQTQNVSGVFEKQAPGPFTSLTTCTFCKNSAVS